MGSHRDWPPLRVCPGRSPRLAVFVALIHLAALLVAWSLPVDVPRIGLLALVCVSALYAFYVQVTRRAPWSIQSATWRPDGTWVLTLVSGREITASLSAATFVSVPLVILNFDLGAWRRRSLLVPADAIAPDQLRRLRQRLRIQGLDSISPMDPGRIA